MSDIPDDGPEHVSESGASEEPSSVTEIATPPAENSVNDAPGHVHDVFVAPLSPPPVAPDTLSEMAATTPEPDVDIVPIHETNTVETPDATAQDTTDTTSAVTVAAPTHAPIIDSAPLSSQGRPSRTPWSARISLLLVAALVGGLAGHYAAPSSKSSGGVTINQVTNPPGAAHLPNGMSIPAIVKKVEPMIVSIDVKNAGEEDQGTGMIITSNGLVVTNNHVIAAAVNGGTITVTRTGSTKSLPATLVGTNPIDDVALIRIDNASKLPVMTFGNSNDVVTGDAVVAIGNALGLAAGTPTVTSGIVSALGRTVTASSDTATETLNNMIQTDAAINPGNSGGPLLDSQGDVIGMNTAVAGTLSDGSNAQNIGFAIPAATIESLLTSLKAGESVVNHGAFIGVEITSMTPELQQEYGFKRSTGAVVMSVIAGTGAAKAGVKQGDIIIGINGTAVTSAQDITSVLSDLHPGDRITLLIVRGKRNIVLHVILGTAPKS
ncbi:MAG: trypsin-like peptidase domain-containing protein [Acidimicrobiales bacterium]